MDTRKFFIGKAIGFLVLAIIVVIYFVFLKNEPNPVENTRTTESSVLGCYAFKLAKDIYTLDIREEKQIDGNIDISGVLSYKNFQKDSSSGSFIGTLKNGLLVGDYSFDSEGMHSIRQIAFKKVNDTFVAGYGPYTTVNGTEKFTDLNNINYDSNQTFIKTNNCNSLSIFKEKDGTFSFNYNPFFSVFENEKKLSKDWRLRANEEGVLLSTLNVPKTYFPNTNFSSAKLTIGRSSTEKEIKECLTEANPEAGAPLDTTFSGYPAKKYIFSDAGAGNFYDTTSYHTILDGDCYVIEYTIHSINIGVYSPDQGIVQFDKYKIQAELEGIISNLKFQLASN
jgi:hypothetical protein